MPTTNSLSHSMPNPDNITRVVLDNGITILVYENFNTRSVVLHGLGLGGALHEDRAYNGVAAMTAG